MQRFKNILVFYNQVRGDEATLDRAIALAKRNQSHLTVIDIVSDESRESSRSALMDERRTHLQRLVVSIKAEGIEVNANVLSGIPFIEIILQVLRNDHDLVVMTADSLVGLKPLLFGSTSMHLMRKCPCPVWVTKPTRRQRYKRILVAVDLESSGADALNQQIMDIATSLAMLERSKLDIVHVWQVTGSDAPTLRSAITDEAIDRLLRDHEDEVRQKLEQLLCDYPMEDIDHHIHLIRGTPGLVIPEVATKQNVDLIVMGTVCRTGVAGFFIGNTAETVLRLVDCAVLTMKPTGFVSPVSLSG